MLNITLYTQSTESILATKYSLHGATKSVHQFFYSGKNDEGKWFRLTNPAATEQNIQELMSKLKSGKMPIEDANSIIWNDKYIIPKANRVVLY